MAFTHKMKREKHENIREDPDLVSHNKEKQGEGQGKKCSSQTKDLRLTLAQDQKPHLQVPHCLHVTETSTAPRAARWDFWSNEHLVREAVPDTHPGEPASSSLFA